MAHEAGKQAAVRAGAALVHDGMTVGLGTGTTAAYFIEALAERIRVERLTLACIATSRGADALALQFGIKTVPLTPDCLPDITIDGADEVDAHLNLIKGGGGALVREKLVATLSTELVVITDSSKVATTLGAFPLPVAVFPFGWPTTRMRITREFGLTPHIRGGEAEPYLTDDGLYIFDLPFGAGAIVDPAQVEVRLHKIVGVAEVGLFVGIAQRLLIGFDDGHVEERMRIDR